MKIPLFKVNMAASVGQEVMKVLYSGYVGEGPKSVELESMVSERFSLPYVLSVNNGTAGLHLAYHIAKSRTGKKKAIVSPMTCLATVSPLVANGIEIVWADIDPISGNIDPDDVAKKIDEDVGFVIMVHWGGIPCKIDQFLELQKKTGIWLVEDAAHAFGAMHGGQKIGSFSDFTMFSLQAIKHVTAVDGGLLVCKTEEDYERAKLLRWYGINRNRKADDLRCSADVAEVGYKFHMNDVNATIAIENLRGLDAILERHRSNAAYYDKAFAGTAVGYAKALAGDAPAYWLYTILVKNAEEVRKGLMSDGIESSKVHSRLDFHSALMMSAAKLPGVTEFYDNHLCIPVGWWVNDEDRAFIVERVNKYARC